MTNNTEFFDQALRDATETVRQRQLASALNRVSEVPTSQPSQVVPNYTRGFLFNHLSRPNPTRRSDTRVHMSQQEQEGISRQAGNARLFGE